MTIRRLTVQDLPPLSALQAAYKAEIHEEPHTPEGLARLGEAIAREQILFFGAERGSELIGMVSVSRTFSTFDDRTGGVLEDLYVCPAFRGQDVARALVCYARDHSGVSTLTVGCADCDTALYRALGFTLRLGNLMAWDE